MLTKKKARIPLIVIASVVVIFSGLYLFSSLGLFVPNWFRGIFEKETLSRYTPAGVRIPDAVFTYNGRVTEIGDGYIIIAARASNNYLEKDVDIRVNFSADTKFVRYALPRGISEGMQIITGLEEPISEKDIITGDTIEVTANENATNSVTMIAERIKLVTI